MRKKSKEFMVDINGKRYEIENQVITYEDIVKLSGMAETKTEDYVLFFNANSKPRRGLLSQGREVILSRAFPTMFQVI